MGVFCVVYFLFVYFILPFVLKNSKNFLYIKSLIYFCIYLNDIYLDMSLTTIVSNVFKPRQKELEKYVYDAEHLQHKVLMHLINKGKNTEYGVKHLLNTTNSYDKFAQNIPVNTYEELKGDIDRMRHGEKDILWPGLVNGTPSHLAPPTIRVSLSRFLMMACMAFIMPEVLMP